MARESEHPRGYERRDMQPRTVGLFGLGLVAFLAISGLLIAGLFLAFDAWITGREPPPPPLAAQRRPPPEPRLQPSPGEDMRRLREGFQKVLGSYAWIDREQGIVRIPIDRAMDLVVERGPPVWPGETEHEKEEAPHEEEEGEGEGGHGGGG